MNVYNLLLLSVIVISIALIIWRLFLLARQGRQAKRRYVAFWLWPAALLALTQLVPVWLVPQALFDAAHLCLAAGMLCDFFFYFGLVHQSKPRQQTLSLLLILPLLAWLLRDHLSWRPRLDLVVPSYGKALVWTDKALDPTTYWFMHTDTRQPGQRNHNYEDPNFGRAIFSPISGKVVAMEEKFLILENVEGQIAIGPIVPSTVRSHPGAAVLANQPLGLLDTGGTRPGIELRLLTGGHAHFQDYFAGIWYATRQRAGFIGRNQIVQSDAATRFRVEN